MMKGTLGLGIAMFILWVICLGSGAKPEATKSTPSKEGLLAYWKFDEGKGAWARDSSGKGNDGEVWNAQWAKGRFGTALYFNGIDSHVLVPEIEGLDRSEELTVEAWVLWEGTGRYPNIVTGGRWNPGGFLLFVSDYHCSFRMGRPGKEPWKVGNGWKEVGVTLLDRLSLGEWYHLAATFKRPILRAFVNGKQVGAVKWDFPVGYSGDLIIGRWGEGVAHHGLIDEVKVYCRALSPEEIEASYQKEALKRVAIKPGEKGYQKMPALVQPGRAVLTLKNEFAKLTIDERASLTELVDKQGRNLIVKPLRFVALVGGGSVFSCSAHNGRLTVNFRRPRVTVKMRAQAKKHYFVFEVLSVDGEEIGGLVFTNLAVKPSKYVSGMSGVAADDEFAVCIRALNLQTSVSVGGKPPVLRATCHREIGFKGSKVALVACPVKHLRSVLKEVVRKEGLTYSPLGGPWALEAEENRGSYIFASVSEGNVDRWIELAKRAGMAQIHLCPWWQSLGHYPPRKDLFPRGIEGLKAVVKKIHNAGLKVGMHTLTGCISPNDPWVTPVPDDRLAVNVVFTLAESIDEKDTSITILEPPPELDTVWAYGSRGNVLRIGDELIMYSGITQEPPYRFIGCKRGAFNTKPQSHEKGEEVKHMFVRYCTFLPDEHTTLVDEVAEAIAHVFNTCGFDMIYMDGAEAMRGLYGIAKMRRAIFERLKGRVVVEASCWDHLSWPFHSRIGAWDHPIWGLKRFVDLHCQGLEKDRKSSLLPYQLGWWAILGPGADHRSEMPDEIEYLCCKALAYDAPISLQGVDVGDRPWNARQEEYLTLIGWYERLRLANYFSEEVKKKLKEPGKEFRLVLSRDGIWEFLPTDYIAHKVTSLHDGSSKWTVDNRSHAQPLKLRIEALYSVERYDSQDALVLASFESEGEFTVHADAPGVTHSLKPSTETVKVGKASGHFTAMSTRKSPRGAWARAGKIFSPPLDMSRYDALGVWIHGDGKGQILNLQLRSITQYWPVFDEHYIKVDFNGWRYFEIPLRERDAEKHGDYEWPYGDAYAIYRNPLIRKAVSELNLYFNNLPPGQGVSCYLSPIKALRTAKVKLRNPALSVNGKTIVFPVTLESGQYLEFEPPECKLFDERGELISRIRPKGEVPILKRGENEIMFLCEGPEGYNVRAEVTVITQGKPLWGMAPKEEIKWEHLRYEYEMPRIIETLDGEQNEREIICRPGAREAKLEIEVEVNRIAPSAPPSQSSEGLTVESFEDLQPFADSPENQYVKYVYDSEHRFVPTKPGVTHSLDSCSKMVKAGERSAQYTATTRRSDDWGWSAKGRHFSPPLDLSKFDALGFWVHGDGKGQILKLQLRDTWGRHFDMVTRVDFQGWRYVQFDLYDALNWSKIEYLIIYYNAIPGGSTVTCYVDEVRAVRHKSALHNLQFTINGRSLVFPLSMSVGDRLVFKGPKDCKLYRKRGREVVDVRPRGESPKLRPGLNSVRFALAPGSPSEFRLTLRLVKVYP